ncbi:MAG: hypothetical protein NTZ77_07730 [Caldiserica bacterium]|nr:hypothetical protein [Caldisericota bacterium]
METEREIQKEHLQTGRRTRRLLFIIIPVVVILGAMLLVWRPWYTPKPYSPSTDPWIHIMYSHSELLEDQNLADSGKHPEFLDPGKALDAFLATDDGYLDLRPQYRFKVQASEFRDYGKDPTNGDRLFLGTFPEHGIFVFFRLRQVLGAGPTKAWSVVGYLIVPYSSSWQERTTGPNLLNGLW